MTLFQKSKIFKILAFLLLPFFCLTILVIGNTINPMALAFLTDFNVENKTNEILFITPIGTKSPNGSWHQLPYSFSSSFYFIIPSKIDYPIEPGGLKNFIYDYDDIQFSEILIRRTGEKSRVFSIQAPLQLDGYYPPERKQFEIKDVNTLPFAKKEHLLALKPTRMNSWAIEILALIGLLSPVFFVLGSRCKQRRVKRCQD